MQFWTGVALGCVGEVAAARTAQAITASGETRRPTVLDKIQRFKFEGDGHLVEASFAVTLSVQIGDTKTWIEAFLVLGSISLRWLSQHRCLANHDPNKPCLESPEIGSVRLLLHSSGHLLLSLVNPSNTLDQCTVMIDNQSSSSGFVNCVQKRDANHGFPQPLWLKCLTQQRLVNRCERGAVPGETDVMEAPRKEEWGLGFVFLRHLFQVDCDSTAHQRHSHG